MNDRNATLQSILPSINNVSTSRLSQKKSSLSLIKDKPAYTFKGRDLEKDVVFKYDASVLSRDTPGPGSSSPFFGGISDKIKI